MATLPENIIYSLTPKHLLDQRDALLQKTMRHQDFDFTIRDEYPIVLAEENSFSYCIHDNKQVFAHINLWPRLTNSKLKVGLVGNVATDPKFQKQGLMKKLMLYVEQQASQSQLEHLILWSDLHTFYQKLGFQSLGSELRVTSKPLPDSCFEKKAGSFFLVQEEMSNKFKFSDLKKLRSDNPTLQRSDEEFKELLSIPLCYLFVSLDKDGVDSYFIVGKGADMGGVVHEWGAAHPKLLATGIQKILEFTEWPELITLIPAKGCEDFESIVKGAKEKHPMALSKPLGASRIPSNFFVWGLDSI